MSDFLFALGRNTLGLVAGVGALCVFFFPFYLGHLVSEKKESQGLALGHAQWAGLKVTSIAYLIYGAVFLVVISWQGV
ncbi:hypothetical protein KEU06_09760 [Pseudaminobacter sp. 19-2017]|uniref:Uncharacterized protein n=1 Tax=Pseudaminobacter soli (ex Zhang et al. 2022) TaxID=2831468 RepID=A0A942DXL9_9HYPH|nr:hypothetical protein [Pseudaminobacter soli]MBS3648892.1 hypothetical protein [Pseudaminobacter soli]